MYITEIGGLQGDTVILQDIFLFVQKEIDKGGKILGEFQATGFIPKFIEVLERKGYNVPRGIFSNRPPGAPTPAPASSAPAAAPAAQRPATPSGSAPAGGVKPPVKK